MKWTSHPISAFADWASVWDTLNHAHTRLPFMDSRVIAAALRWLGEPGLVLMIGSRAGAPCAMGILKRRGGMWDTWQPSQLPLGAWLMAGEAWGDTAPSLLRALPGVALGAGFSQQDPALYPRPMSPAQTLDYVPTARLMIEGSFEDYWAARGKNLRHNTKRQHAKLAAAGTQAALQCLMGEDEVAPSITDYSALEGAGWKAQQGTALSADNPQGQFYREALNHMAQSRQTRIYRYTLDEQVVAMDLCLTQGEVMVILKTACRDDLQGLSPAVLMHRDIFASLFDEGTIKRVEFYGRVMEWHTRWTEDTRMLYHANFYPWRWLSAWRQSRTVQAA